MSDEAELLRRLSDDSQTSSATASGSITTTATIHSRHTSSGSVFDADVTGGPGQPARTQNADPTQNQGTQQRNQRQIRAQQHPHKLHKKISASTPEMQAQLDCLIHGICPMPDKKQRKTSSTEQIQQQQSLQIINELPQSMVPKDNTSVVENNVGSTVVLQGQGINPPQHPQKPTKKMSASSPEMQAQLDCLLHGICPMPDKKHRKISFESGQQQGVYQTQELIKELPPSMVAYIQNGSDAKQGYDNPGYIVTSPLDISNLTSIPEKQELDHDHHQADSHCPEASSPEEKSEWFSKSLSTQLSMIYGLFIVICGTTFYIGDSFQYSYYVLGEAFNIYIMTVALIFLLYIHYDVRQYLNKVSRSLDEAKAGLHAGNATKEWKVPERHYGFTSGRHGGSLYLKIGATCFCFGYLTYIGLSLGKMFMHIGVDDCYNLAHVIGNSIHTIYIFYQLFFLFKYSNLIINRNCIIARFGLMHCIATSICFWIFLIYFEVLHSIYDKEYVNDPPTGNNTGSHWVVKYGCKPTINSTQTDGLDGVINALGPYLYPFGVEFNILIVGLWILIWENLGKIENHDHMPSIQITAEDNTDHFESNLTIQVDCHSSNRGIFIGLLFTIYIIISIIITFVYTYEAGTGYEDEYYTLGMYIRGGSELLILMALLVSTLIAYRSIQNLDIISHEISSVDDLLLFISLPFIFFFAFINLAAHLDQKTIPTENLIFIIVMVFYILQPIVQTLFICDGLRRCSNTAELQFKKPGREVVTFLVITNVTMWLLETMQINTYGANEMGYYYFGKTMWKVMSHIAMPLSLFYRFHSSVCIADIWADAYEKEEHH